MQKGKCFLLTLVVVVIVLVLSQALFAHSDWLNPRRAQGIFLEVNRPDFKNNNGDFGVWSLFLSGEIRAARNANLILELPYVHYSEDQFAYFGQLSTSASESLIGNPYVGLRSASAENGFCWEVGGRLPIASEDSPNAALAGAISHYPRLEAFVPELASVRGMFGYQYTSPEGMIMVAEVGPDFAIPTKHREYNEDELLADYSFQLWAHVDKVEFGGALYGSIWISQSGIDFSDRMVTDALLAVQARVGQLRPGLHLIVPLNNTYYDEVNVVIGGNIAFYLPTKGK